MKEKIEQRVIGLFVLMLAILGYIAWSSMKTPVEAKKSSDWVNKTHAIIIDVNAVLSSLHAGDSALRTYLLTGDPRDQGAYRSAIPKCSSTWPWPNGKRSPAKRKICFTRKSSKSRT